MFKTAVRADGTIQLGELAQQRGFRPGTPVEVAISRAGGLLLISIDDSHALDVKPSAMVSARVWRQLTGVRREEG